MKRQFQILVTASTTSLMALSALCKDTANPNPEPVRPGRTDDRPAAARRMNHLNDAAKASDIIGMTVKNYQGDKLGKVEDLAVDVESGRIVQVILSTGGFIGIGDTLSAVPPGALHHDVEKKVLHLNADKAKLKAAPKFEMSNWAGYSDADHLSEVYRHYGEEPAYRFVQQGEARADQRRNREPSAAPGSVPKEEGALNRDDLSRDSRFMIPASRLTQVQKASKLIGTPVQNLHDEKLGKVENLLVDLPSGRVIAIIVASGGFLGMGNELSAVPPSALQFTTDRSALQLDTTKEMLANAPHFKSDQWPDFAQPSYSGTVYRAYRVEPYFTTEIDNTGRNVRDRDGQALTPLDQGNSKADVDTTARIRKGVMAEKNMSINAQNVKIITLNGRVTLRGPVNTGEEKARIAEIAERIARSENVDNQLEVKPANATSSNN